MTTSPRKSVLALGVVSALMAGALFAVSVPTAANASTSSTISSIIAKLNAYRVANSTFAAMGRNAFIDLDAQEYAEQYASDPTGNLDDFTPSTPLPLDAASDEPTSVSQDKVAVSESGSVTKIVATFIARDSAGFDTSDNYVGVGYATKGSHAYAYLVLTNYTHQPLLRITPGTITLPSTVRLGLLTATLHGFSQSGVTYSYAWTENGTGFGGSADSVVLYPAELNATIKVTVTASKPTYADTVVVSNTTKPAETGIPSAPSKIAAMGQRNVGQTLYGPPEGMDGWGPDTLSGYAYQWLRNGKAIVGQTGDTYVLTTADYGKRIDVRMSLTGPDYGTTTRTSDTHTLIAHPLITELSGPELLGGDDPWGVRRTAEYSIFSAGTHYEVTWLLNGHSAATGYDWTPPASAGGKQLSFRVTGTRSGYAATSYVSNSVNVLDKNYTASAEATITGTTGPSGSAELTDHLKAKVTEPAVPKPTSYTYQWFLDGTAVKGDTGLSFKWPKGITSGFSVDFQISPHITGYYPDPFDTDVLID